MSCIHLLPLGNADREMVAQLRHPLHNIFSATVEEADLAVDLEPFYDEQRGQYNSTDILLWLKEHVSAALRPAAPCEGPRYLAVCAPDLFTPILTFVFGEAEFNGRVAIVSYYRLRNELYGLASDPDLLFDRLLKESVHELGHTAGLVHCRSPRCVMRSSTSAEEIDLKDAAFCAACDQRRVSLKEAGQG
jgi:archaemetzincin